MGLRPGFCSRFWHFPPFLIPVIRLFGFRVFLYTSRSLRTFLPCLHAGVPDLLRVGLFRGFMRFPAACEMFCVQGNHILFRWSSWGVSHLGTWESPPFQSTGNGFS
jgi:hypothetical protein